MLNKVHQFVRQYQEQKWFSPLCLLAITCLVMLPLPLLGIPIGTDLTQHLQFAATYHDSILAGDFFPGWAGSDNHGFGSIGIRFYPPTAYYFLAFTQIITGDWFTSIWTNAFFWMLVGCVGMYLWAREWLSPFEAICAAAFYAFIPYHRFQIYQLILFAEFAAAGILPFCFLTVTKVIRRGKAIDVIGLAVAIALLILTHIPTTIVGLTGLGIYALLLIDWKSYRSVFAKLFIAFGLSLLASSFHWLRLLSEIDLVKHNSENYTVEFYDYKQHFFPLADNLKSILPPLDTAIILIFLSLLPLMAYYFLKSKSLDSAEKKVAIALTFSGLFCFFLMTAPSSLVWEKVSFLQKIQFPWRWLSVASVIASPALIFAVSKFIKTMQKSANIALTLLFVSVFIYFFIQTITPSIPLNREEFIREIAGLKDKNGCECWHPVWAKNEALNQTEKVFAPNRTVSIVRWESEAREFTVGAGESQKIRIATFYYPHWQAEINGKSVEIETDVDGSILIPVSNEESTIKLNFREPKMLQLALAGSLLTWLSLIIASFLIYRKTTKSR